MSVIRPAPLKGAITASFCLGACLANTEINGTRAWSADCASGWSKIVFGLTSGDIFCHDDDGPVIPNLIFLFTVSIAIFVRVSPMTQIAAILDVVSISFNTFRFVGE